MTVVAVEEHWNTTGIDRALRSQRAGADDPHAPQMMEQR